jgi:hypothetical protein
MKNCSCPAIAHIIIPVPLHKTNNNCSRPALAYIIIIAVTRKMKMLRTERRRSGTTPVIRSLKYPDN